MTETATVERDWSETESWACRECPVKDCSHRLLNADTGGRHLDLVHGEAGRWSA